jgi:hypothetical protein
MLPVHAATDLAEAVLARPLEDSKRFISTSVGWRLAKDTKEPKEDEDKKSPWRRVAMGNISARRLEEIALNIGIETERPRVLDYNPGLSGGVILHFPKTWTEKQIVDWLFPYISGFCGEWLKYGQTVLVEDDEPDPGPDGTPADEDEPDDGPESLPLPKPPPDQPFFPGWAA